MIYSIIDKEDNEISIFHYKGRDDVQISINHVKLFELQKNELEEFIGALLHIQAKIRNGGKNVK